MDSPKDRRSRPEGPTQAQLFRLLIRAAFFAAPDTLLTAREFAWVMNLRASRVVRLNPPTLRVLGSSKRAPFKDWRAALEQETAPGPTPAEPDQPSLAQLRRPRPGAGR